MGQDAMTLNADLEVEDWWINYVVGVRMLNEKVVETENSTIDWGRTTFGSCEGGKGVIGEESGGDIQDPAFDGSQMMELGAEEYMSKSMSH